MLKTVLSSNKFKIPKEKVLSDANSIFVNGSSSNLLIHYKFTSTVTFMYVFALMIMI
jgi:hypothetical protein